MQGPTRDAKLAAMGPKRLASSVRLWFVEATSTMEKAVLCYKADRLVASLLGFRSIQSSLAVRKFRAAGEERCERGHGRVHANLWCLMLWHPKCNCSYVTSADLPSDSLCKNLAWWVVTWRTLKKHKTVKIGGWALAWVWALARDNTVINICLLLLCTLC